MKNFFKSFKYGKKGFTLIELLVVVAILGVLAAVAIPNVGKFVNSANIAAGNTELASALTAAAAYMAENPDNAAAFDETALTDYVDAKGFIGTYDFTAAGDLDETTAPTYKSLDYSTTTHQFVAP